VTGGLATGGVVTGGLTIGSAVGTLAALRLQKMTRLLLPFLRITLAAAL
jgi:hypothetical protein